MAQTLVVVAIMTLSWAIVGYTLAFGGDGTIIGSFDHVILNGIGYDDVMDGGIPELEFVMFQCAFALITAGIVIGACAERIHFKAIALFLIIWSVVVYAPMAHWVWGGGLFDEYFTVLDFAGGTVVHICAATTGLALAVFVGRRGDRVIKDRAHNLPLVFIGFTLLWFGWLGFNGGSGLAADGIATNAILVTQLSMATAMAVWALIQYFHTGHVGVLGLISGGVAGLVAITPAAGYVTASSAIIIGAVCAPICYFGVLFMRRKSGIDDALDVFGVHGLGGIWGSVATGIFALESMGGAAGLIEGGTDLFVGQIVAVIITLVYCFAMSYVIIFLVSKVTPVRLSEDEEAIGADIMEHGEPSYII
jgi:Amt family ammonium transporter